MKSLFEQFEGADLDRLIECLNAINAAGLRVDKYTQAGVNQNSGNVWIWSEDWSGCVYCSIGFDVAWCYSCPDCGEEHDFENYSEMTEYAERYSGCCKGCKPSSSLNLLKDGIEGEEVSWQRVPTGNVAFQYVLGKVEEDGVVAIFRRKESERGTYGGWRWEADFAKLATDFVTLEN